jgi:DNA-binding LytR/AlgR family response regulator
MEQHHDPDFNAAVAHHAHDGSSEPVILPIRPPRSPQPTVEDHADCVFIRDRSGLQRICRSGILLLRADGNYVELLTTSKRFVLRTSLRDVIQQLGEQRFPQVNRNTAVNLDRLDRVDLDSVEVEGEVITLSRSYRSALLDRLQVLSGR